MHRVLPSLIVLTAIALPRLADACSWQPEVATTRVEGALPSCIQARETDEPIPGSGMDDEYDPYRTNLLVRSTCGQTLELSIEGCVGCDGPFRLEPRPDGHPASVIVDVGVHIDDAVGRDVEVRVDWVLEGEADAFWVVFEMADVHPDDQTGCEGCLCAASGHDEPPLLGVLVFVMLAGLRRAAGQRDA